MKDHHLKIYAVILGILGSGLAFLSNQFYWSFVVSIDFGPYLLIFLPYLVMTIIACFLKREVFRRWFFFSIAALLFYGVVMYLIFPTGDFGGGWSGLKAGYDALIPLGLIALYVLVSIGIFIFGSIVKKSA